LKDIATISKGQKLSYVVDAVGSEDNIEKIVELVKGSDLLYIETYFADKDKDRAIKRYHLTAKEAGKIARQAGVGRMEPIHFSPKYTSSPEELIREAKEEFDS
jgi:ribonuclease Z